MRLFAYSTTLVLVLSFAAGCGGSLPPNDKLISAEAAARSAREVGAPGVPQAALELRLAEEQIAKAKALMAEGDNERAELMLQRAQADAELALTLAREDQTRKEAQQLSAQVEQLRGQLK